MKKISKSIIFRLFIFALVIILICIIPNIPLMKNNNLELIYSKFVGEKSEFQGMIEIWNIDTFEGGAASKKSILSAAANNFQTKNKGTYVLVKNLSEGECINLLSQGEMPDLFSCSYNTFGKIKSNIMPFSNDDYDILNNFLVAGQDKNGLQYGLAWQSGFYFLMSTKSSLEKAGIVADDNFNLIKNAYSLGFVKNGKKSKNIYSVAMVNNGYLMPQFALNSYYDNKSQITELSFKRDAKFSQYEAYVEFLTGNSVSLLGTVRDVKRLYDKEKNGKIADVLYQPLLSFSDLVQFLFLAKGENQEKQKISEKFAKFILSDAVQSKLTAAGIYSVKNGLNQTFEIPALNMITQSDLEKVSLKSIFDL